MTALELEAQALGKWPRDLYAEAVWSSKLATPQLVVALAYADHAGPSSPPSAWVTRERLQERTRLGRTAATKAVRELVELGWLVPLERPRKGFTATYRLAIPSDQKAASRPTPDEKAASRPTGQAEGRLATEEGRLATPEGRLAAPTSLPTSLLTPDARAPQEARPVYDDRSAQDEEEGTSSAARASRAAAAAGKPAAAWTVPALEALERRLVSGLGVPAPEAPHLLLAGAQHPRIDKPGGIAADGFLAELRQTVRTERRRVVEQHAADDELARLSPIHRELLEAYARQRLLELEDEPSPPPATLRARMLKHLRAGWTGPRSVEQVPA